MREKTTASISDVITDEETLSNYASLSNQTKNKQQNIPIPQARVLNVAWPKIFLTVAFISTIAGAIFATKTLVGIEKSIADAKEEARAANIKIKKITTSSCTDCFNLDNAIATLKKQNVSVSEEKAVSSDSKEGQALIKQFGIKRLPTYILTGEVTKKTIEGFIKNNGEVKEKTFIFTKVTPLFVDTTTKKEMGKVSATIISDPTCSACIDPKLTLESYKKAGVKIIEEKEVAWNSSEGQELISQYKITKLPTFILSSDIDFYDNVKTNWTRIGTIESDKTYIARNLTLPYRDMEKGQIIGLVDIIYLIDASCNECYDVEEVQRPILTKSFGVGFSSERTVDVSSSEGQGLVSQYKITKVPTILLSTDADEYIGLKNVWPSVGTVEADGRYVFREMARIGNVTYNDLASNQVVNATKQTPTVGQRNP